MTELLLVGASGLAREVLTLLRNRPEYAPVGILDDLPELQGSSVDGVPVLGGLDQVARHPLAQLVLCVGQGSERARILDRLTALGVAATRYATVVHPGVELPADCEVGSGSVLLAGVVLTAVVRIGRHVVVMPNSTLTHDVVVEDFATLCAGVALGGGVHVGRAAYIGMNASVRERVTIGPGAILGMGAALLTELPAGETWVGVPAAPADRSR